MCNSVRTYTDVQNVYTALRTLIALWLFLLAVICQELWNNFAALFRHIWSWNDKSPHYTTKEK